MSSGSGAQAVFQVLVLVTLARLLGPVDFGVVSAAVVVTGLSTIFSKLGIGPAIVQLPHLEKRHLATGFTLSVGFGAGMAALVFLVAPLLAAFFGIEGLTPILRVLSGVFLFHGAGVVAESLLQRSLRFRALAGATFAAYALGYGAVGVSLAFLGFGPWALVGAHVGHAALKCGLHLTLQAHPKVVPFDAGAARDLLTFGTGYTLAHLGGYVAFNGDNLVVARWLGAEALGLYGRAFQLMVTPTSLFGQVLADVLFPTMARVQHDRARLAAAYRRGVALTSLVILPSSVVLVTTAPEIVAILLGPGWEGVVFPLRILALGMLLRASYRVSDALTRALGAVYRRAWRQWLYALLVLGGSFLGHPWGLAGVSVGVLLALAANFLLMAGLSLRLTGLRWSQLVAAHAVALPSAAAVGVLVGGFAAVARSFGVGAFGVLAGAALLFLAFGASVAAARPRLFLGRDGRWALDLALEHLGARGRNSTKPRTTDAPEPLQPGPPPS